MTVRFRSPAPRFPFACRVPVGTTVAWCRPSVGSSAGGRLKPCAPGVCADSRLFAWLSRCAVWGYRLSPRGLRPLSGEVLLSVATKVPKSAFQTGGPRGCPRSVDPAPRIAVCRGLERACGVQRCSYRWRSRFVGGALFGHRRFVQLPLFELRRMRWPLASMRVPRATVPGSRNSPRRCARTGEPRLSQAAPANACFQERFCFLLSRLTKGSRQKAGKARVAKRL